MLPRGSRSHPPACARSGIGLISMPSGIGSAASRPSPRTKDVPFSSVFIATTVVPQTAATRRAFGAIGRLSPNYVTQDGVVPRSKLPEIMEFIQETIMKINQQQWSQEYQSATLSAEQQAPVTRPRPVIEPQVDGLSYELLAYPEDLMQRARIDLGLQRNPYAPTTKFLRRRMPSFGFNQTSR